MSPSAGQGKDATVAGVVPGSAAPESEGCPLRGFRGSIDRSGWAPVPCTAQSLPSPPPPGGSSIAWAAGVASAQVEIASEE
eukprot:9416997-Pyramimonas_sp.AAC.1